ncbi:hypothetical protein KDM41_10165, partial [bacterium]|nr:hypothetical protein [bacterium]
RAPGAPVQMILVSDLQDDGAAAAGWAPAVRRLRETGEVHLLLHQVGEPAAGGAVLAVDLPGRAVRPGENVTIRATVRPEFNEQIFVLELDGRPVGEAVTGAAADGAVTLDFPLTIPTTGRHPGAVRKETDALPADDSRAFVLEVPAVLDVLIAHGADQPRDGIGGRGGRRYLAEALAPGSGASVFRTRMVPTADLTTGDITAADVVVLVDPDPLGRRVQEGLQAWLADGGQAVFIVGDPKLTAWLGDTLLPALGLPTAVGFAAVAAPGERSRVLAPDHPVFRGLEPAALTTFGEIAWRRWFRLAEGEGRVLVALTGDDPLVIERDVGAGRAVVVAAHLQPAAGDLPGSPMALPFLQRLVAWLAGGGAAAAHPEAGDELVLRPHDRQVRDLLERTEALRVVAADGTDLGPAAVTWRGGAPRLDGGVADRAGLVFFRAGGDTAGVAAVGTPPAESALALHTPDDYGRLLAAAGLAPRASLGADGPAALMAVLGGRDLTPWLLAAAVLLLVAELALGRGARA